MKQNELKAITAPEIRMKKRNTTLIKRQQKTDENYFHPLSLLS